LLVLARVSSMVVLVPIPGWRSAFDSVKIVLALTISAALFPVWPKVEIESLTIGMVAGWIAAEIAFGLVAGVAVTFLIETFVLAAQVFGLQAGYSYASTIDPSTDADSSVLQVITQLIASLLFFAFRLDSEVIRAFAESLLHYPPGRWNLTWA